MASAVGRFDVVITTAQVPGRRPPRLDLRGGRCATMRPGSVVVDLAASELGGNVEGSLPDTTIVVRPTASRVDRRRQPASAVPQAASTAYARNVAALLTHLVQDGELVSTRPTRSPPASSSPTTARSSILPSSRPQPRLGDRNACR